MKLSGVETDKVYNHNYCDESYVRTLAADCHDKKFYFENIVEIIIALVPSMQKGFFRNVLANLSDNYG